MKSLKTSKSSIHPSLSLPFFNDVEMMDALSEAMMLMIITMIMLMMIMTRV